MTHILYNYRRCPYAMRARMALKQAQIKCDIIDISFKQKPPEMLAVSAKGTVPVLISEKNNVLDESLDIMYWALKQSDPDKWLGHNIDLIQENDSWFKKALDQYKYPSRYPNDDCTNSRDIVESFFKILNNRLENSQFLYAPYPTLADIAIFPFIRQAANVDKDYFNSLPLIALKKWLEHLLNMEIFKFIFQKKLKQI